MGTESSHITKSMGAGSKRRSRPTIVDVANAAGVSKSTVSRVIQKDPRVADETRQLVEAAITTLGYVPAISAQLMRTAPDPTIGLFISSVDIPIFAQLNRHLHEELTAQGFHVIQQTIVDSTHQSREDAMENLARMPIQGMLVSVGGVESEQHLRFAERLPLVVVGRPEPTGRLNNIGFDEDYHAHLLVDHLAELGHTRIMVQEAPRDRSMGTWVRVQAEKRYARSLGLDVDSAVTYGMGDDELRRWVEDTVDRGFTAISSLFDRKALQVLRVAKEAGIDVPGELSVTGSDGVLDGLDLIGLTTVQKPVEMVGRRAAQRIVEMVQATDGPDTPVRELHRGSLAVRGTTAKVNEEAAPLR